MAPSSASAIPLFAAELGEDARQRRALIPKIAKALSAWNHMVTDASTNIQLQSQDVGNTSSWIEERLWLSMTQALGLNVEGVQVSSAGIMSTCSRERNKITNAPVDDDHALAFSDSTRDDSQSAPRADVAAKRKNAPQYGNNSFELLYQRHNHDYCAGVSNELFDSVNSTTMHDSTATLTHIDQKGVWNRRISGPRNLIGQKELTHCSYSDLSHEQREHSDILEEDLICENNRPPSLFFRQSTAIEGFESDTDLLSLADDGTIATPVFTASEESLIDNMDTSDSRQSLTDVLGDDMLLWSMWKRRPSTYPHGEDDAELLHDMLQNDPDMKLFSPTHEDDMSFNDIMMLDSWDFSRKSSSSSTFTTADSDLSKSFGQLEQSSPYSCSSQISSAPGTGAAPIRDAKEEKRQLSVQKKVTRPAIISEDDMLFQQTSPPRRVDIKSRKGMREHSGRR